MPKDIRAYFPLLGNKSKKNNDNKPEEKEKPKKKKRIISSDEEEVKVLTPVKKQKLTKKPAAVIEFSDSDDDFEPTSSSKKKNVEREKPAAAKPRKLVSASEMFGSKPVERVKAPVVVQKPRPEVKDAKKDKKGKKKAPEAMVHDDDDFDKTLCDLDCSQFEEEIAKKEEKKEQRSPKKNKEQENGNAESKRKMKQDETPKKESPKKAKREEKIQESPKTSKKPSTSKRNYEIEVEKVKKVDKKPEKNDETDYFEEKIEKKKQHAAFYQKYLQRGGARNPGCKEIPEGAENCLAGLSFVITGVFESMERDEADELIQKYSGRVLSQPSKKTSYMIVGDEPGPSKVAKANTLGIKQISEDELLELIRTRPRGNAENIVKTPKSRATKREREKSPEPVPVSPPKVVVKPPPPPKESPKKPKEESSGKPEAEKKVQVEEKPKIEKQESKVSNYVPVEPMLALVDKYRPQTMKNIIGQQGDKSNVKKLHFWLSNWHKNRKTSQKKPGPWAKNDDGAFYKAALLSGPPGVGKTTSAQIVSKELGFDLLEFNASDKRSKRALKEEVSELLSNKTVKGFFQDGKSEKPRANQVLLMDEVDGMAGNEDRGGLQELIQLIKAAEVPVICICNDRNHPKMRTLSNYTFDLRYQKPRLEQIRGAMKSICFKEKINISTEDLDRLIISTNQDLRQVINHLSLFLANSSSVSSKVETAAKDKVDGKKSGVTNKDVRLGPFDVCKLVFSKEDHKKMTIHDKSDLFFHDYNIAGLFVQENYLSTMAHCPKRDMLAHAAISAECLALGDICDKAIRSRNAWSLLPIQAIYQSVIPGTLMAGSTGPINFPTWLGRNSKRGKQNRLMQEVASHTRLTTCSDKSAINLDYATHLRNAITRPIVKNGTEGIEDAMKIMNTYHLLKDDLDSLTEICNWPGRPDPMQSIDSKVKAAFTRTYNKTAAPIPYVIDTTISKKRRGAAAAENEELLDGEEAIEDSGEESDSLESDKMIKAKKAPVKKAPAQPAASTSKAGKGKAPKGKATRGKGSKK